MNEMLKDRLGRQVVVGCTVAYPGRQGSSCWLTTGTVVGIVETFPDDDPVWRRRPKLKVEGGTRGANDTLGRRTIGWSDDVLVVG